MKIRRSFVLFCTVLVLCPVGFAQEIPAEAPTPFVSLFATLKRSEGKGVYEPKISAVELAKREREDVEANREVLVQLRVLLKESVQRTPTDKHNFKPMGHMREFARLLSRESNVRLADGDAVGAMQSRLDCYHLAVVVSRGGMILDNLVSSAIEAIAWKDIEKVGSKLDGKSCLEFSNSIENLRREKPNYISILENEKAYSISGFRTAFNSPDWKTFTTYQKKTSLFSKHEIEELKALSAAQIEANIAAAYDADIDSAKKPFGPTPKKFEAADAYSGLVSFTGMQTRFLFENRETCTRLVEAALLVRARQQGAISGEEFARLLPTDPFGSVAL